MSLEDDLRALLRQLHSEAMALDAVGTRLTKPYSKTIISLAERAYDLAHQRVGEPMVPSDNERLTTGFTERP